ncbi:MAG: hypothetical protein K8S98_09610 [Planctomycetes bacterium]|nr:hypothetical protein [Planctomycetota bacterium]
MSEKNASSSLRELLCALVLGAVGCLGILPVSAHGSDLFASLAWIALAAAPLGASARALGVRLVPYGFVAPGVWMAGVACLDAAIVRDLPTPLWGALAWSGLYAGGWALAAAFARNRWRVVFALTLAVALLAALPEKGGLAREPWDGEFVATTLDLSPVALVTESSGAIDWPWAKSHYATLGVDRFERRPFRGRLAGPVALVVGCVLAWLARTFARSREPAVRPAE